MWRGVKRLDGAWDKKQVWRPMLEPEVFRKKMYCFEKVLMALLWVLAPRRDSAVGELCPFAPSLRLWRYAIKIGKCSENKQIFMSERHELLFHAHLQFPNTIRHGSCTDCQQRLLAALQISSCSFCVTSMPAPRVFLAWTCVCFANNKTFPTFNKLLF